MIIGLTGSAGAGKDTVAEYLTSKGFKKFVYSDYIRTELEQEGKPANRNNLIEKGNEIRSKHGAGELSVRILADIDRDQIKKAVLVGARNPEEIGKLRQRKNFSLWFIDAPLKVRYERIKDRKSIKDNVTYEEFVAQEERENSNDANSQQLKSVAVLADETLQNTGEIDFLHQQIDRLLSKIEL